MNTKDVNLAKEIAFTIREKGRIKRNANRKFVRDEQGNPIYAPGIFKNCKAVGWYMDDFGRAQISINLTNFNVTPPHLVFDECCKLATDLGVRVTGSELVGLIPLAALLEAGNHYLKKQGNTAGISESEIIHIAILSMGLDDLYPFENDKKIIEYQMDKSNELTSMKVDDFVELLSSDAPAPGGGSVAALSGSISCALSSMVAALTHGKKGYKDVTAEMEEVGIKAQKLKDAFVSDVDKDTDAFNKIMTAFRLPKKSEEEITARLTAIEDATKEATLVPFDVLKRSLEAAKLARTTVEKGNKNSISDAGVAALSARVAAEGAYLNVKINLPGINDNTFRTKTLAEAQKIRQEVIKHTEETIRITDEILDKEE